MAVSEKDATVTKDATQAWELFASLSEGRQREILGTLGKESIREVQQETEARAFLRELFDMLSLEEATQFMEELQAKRQEDAKRFILSLSREEQIELMAYVLSELEE